MAVDDETPPVTRPRVVIIGGGFGGLHAAQVLRKADADIFLVDRENFHLFQPLLYQVATAGLGAEDIASPIRTVLRKQDNCKVVMGEVHDIDRSERRVYFEGGQLAYDYLIVAAGMVKNYFGNEEWEKFAPGLKTLGDALDCRQRILKAFERAEWTDDPELTRALLTFVVVGAGPTGVEMAGAIREIAHRVMVRDFRNIDASKARVILVDAQSQVLAEYHETLSEQARQDLEEMGVEVRLDEMVEEITDKGVAIDGEFIASHTVIWAAGVEPSPLADSLKTPLDGMGRVMVEPDLRLPDDDRVFVIGDMAHFEQQGEPLPGLAPVAIQQGKRAARNILRRLRGESTQQFEYNDRGHMATLGRARAVADVYGRRFSGFFAWVLWLFVHLLFLIGFRNKIFVLLDWAYAYVGMRRSGRLIVDTPYAGEERRDVLRGLPEIDEADQIDVSDVSETPSEAEPTRRRANPDGGE